MAPSVAVRAATAHETRAVGEALARLLAAGDVVVLTGRLGAGKTTLVGGLATGLGITGPVTSPTFVIAHEMRGGRLPLVHVDAYRLASALELDDLDLDTDLADAVVVVEWGEGLAERLSGHRLEVVLDRGVHDDRDDSGSGDRDGDGEARVVTVTGVGDRWAGVDLASALAGVRP